MRKSLSFRKPPPALQRQAPGAIVGRRSRSPVPTGWGNHGKTAAAFRECYNKRSS